MSDTYSGVCKVCKQDTDLIEGICANCSFKDRKIHEWDISDEYGWRNIELWEKSEGKEKRLELVAFDKDGGEVEPRV